MNINSTNQDPIYSYRPLFGNWQIYSFIGEGSYGKVYKIVRQEFGFTYTSAVKIITVPSKDQLKQALSSFGDNQEDLKLYFSEMVSNIVKEINILYKLKSCPNIVSYEDHMVIEKKEDIGWDILIRMEYLTPLPEYLKRNRLNTRDIINLGIDILSAISLCHKNNIIHRDIKDENIFITDNKTFKLGDFGIARELSKSGKASSFKGTPIYMSPEVFKAEKYDVRSDIYSLGILLYKLTNKSRIPFMPAYPESIRYSDFDLAIDKRLKGLPLTLPSHSGKELGAIILKACSYNVSNRYQTPSDMSDELKKLLLKLDKSFLNKDITFINQPEPESTVPLDIEAPKAPAPVQKPERKEIKKGLIIGLSVSLVIIIAAAGYVSYLFFKSSTSDKEVAMTTTSEVSESIATAGTTAEESTTESTSAVINTSSYIYKILFSSDSDGDSDIYSMNTDSTELINLTNNDLEQWSPSYSNKILKVVFICRTIAGDGNSDEIFIMNIDGSNKKQLTNDVNSCWSPSISPDGSKIAFTSNKDGNPEIYIMNSNGSSEKRLTYNNSFDDWAKFSPDGKYIVFHSDRSGNSEVYIMNSDGSNVKKLTINSGWDGYPNFSPDGYRIVFTSYRNDNDDIYIMNIDGSNQTRLTESIDHDIFPAFSLDGNKITFTRITKYNDLNNQGKIYMINPDGSGEVAISLLDNRKESIFITNKNNAQNFIEVSSTNREGIKFITPEDGTYEFKIVGGAVNYYWFPFTENQKFDWNNVLWVFINQSIKWGGKTECGKEILNRSRDLGKNGYESFQKAEKDLTYYGFKTPLIANDYMIFVVPDGYDCYEDNYGTMIVNIRKISD